MSVRVVNNIYPVLRKRFWQQTLTDILNTGFFIINKMEKEIWKDIKGYEGYYQISSFGLVKRIKDKQNKCERFLKYGYRKGYAYVDLSLKNKTRKHSIHRLIANAFIPNPENKYTVNHIDGIKSNNTLINLEWATSKENLNHARSLKLNNSYGENVHCSKLKEFEVKEIRNQYNPGGYSFRELAKKYGCSNVSIANIINKKTWRHLL